MKKKTVEAVIEIPKGTSYKYEYKNKKLVLDRPLNQKIPFNYGFIPNTLAEDGDPLDVFVITNEKIDTLVHCPIRIIAAFKCFDNNIKDDKLIAVLEGFYGTTGKAYEHIQKYLNTYKKGFVVSHLVSKQFAEEILKESKKRFKK